MSYPCALRQRAITLSVSTALGAGLLVAPHAAADTTATCADDQASWSITGGTFEWNLRDSWNNYLNGPIANGKSEVGGAVTNIGPDKRRSNFRFEIASGAVAAGNFSAQIPGSMSFQGHAKGEDYVLDNSFENFTLQVEGTTATLSADTTYRQFVDTRTVGERITKTQMPLSTWTLSAPITPAEGSVTFASAGNGTFVHPDAIEAFGRFYGPGNDYTGPLTAGSLTFERSCTETGTEPGNGNGTEPGNGNGTEPGNGNGTEPGNGNGTEPSVGSSGSSSRTAAGVADARAGLSQFWGIASVLGVGAVLAGVAYQLINTVR